MALTLALTLAALLIEAVVGYPPAIFAAVRHPVVWIGALIGSLDRHLPRTRAAGVLALCVVLALTAAPSALIAALHGWAGFVVVALAASTLPAQRSLGQHVAAVGAGLRQGVLPGRAAVAQIVGRDTDSLDGPGVARAAIESLAENFSDGVVGPAFWGCVGGLPGMALYKAVNTADSMIGHRTPRHERFGWASARFDDLVNLPASRLAAFWIVLAAMFVRGAEPRRALHALRRDAARHRSPNAGWPEAAMAGALGVRLAGPRRYDGVMVDDAWMGDGTADLGPGDIARALLLYRVACAVQIAAVGLLAVLFR